MIPDLHWYCLPKRQVQQNHERRRIHTSGHAAIGGVTQSMDMESMLPRVQSLDLSLHGGRTCKDHQTKISDLRLHINSSKFNIPETLKKSLGEQICTENQTCITTQDH
jgi:hypothetical protein